jgi:hypothetical protein
MSPMWLIIDTAERRIVESDFDSREDADARLAKLIEDDPANEHVLKVFSDKLPNAANGEPDPG